MVKKSKKVTSGNVAQYYRKASTNWDVSAVVFAVVVALFEMMLLFAKPTISLFGKSTTVTNGILAFATLTGGLFWALIEVVTRPRRSIVDLLVRFFGAFIIGSLVGGVLGTYYDFGQYLLVPMYAGNELALFEVITIFIAFIIMVANAAWAHNKRFVASRVTG